MGPPTRKRGDAVSDAAGDAQAVTGGATGDDRPKAGLSRYQSFAPERVHRRKLVGADYNPRVITDDEKKRLRRLLKKHGLFNALVWNRRTGRRVAGHQRLVILDALEGTDDYLLDVNVVDVDEKQEREMNVAHNNQAAAGDYDLEKLGLLFRDTDVKIDIDATGWDQSDVYKMFGDTPFEDRPDELAEIAESVRSFSEQVNAGHDRAVAKHSTNFYTVLVWKDEAARDEAHRLLGLPDPENRFQDGRRVLETLRLVREDEGAGPPARPGE
jgi:hypothetical protein